MSEAARQARARAEAILAGVGDRGDLPSHELVRQRGMSDAQIARFVDQRVAAAIARIDRGVMALAEGVGETTGGLARDIAQAVAAIGALNRRIGEMTAEMGQLRAELAVPRVIKRGQKIDLPPLSRSPRNGA